MDQYDIFVTAHLIRQRQVVQESFVVHIQKASSVVSEKNTLHHTFNPTESEKLQSEEIYLGRLGVHEEINIVFRNQTEDFMEDVTIPVICLKSDSTPPELTLAGENVELKVLFVLDHVFVPKSELSPKVTKFVPSSRAYQTIRNGVIAVANTRHFVGDSLHALAGTVQYAVDSSRFVLTIGYNLSTDFLTNVDILFDEGSQAVDSQLDAAKNVLFESLAGLTKVLHQQLQSVDELVSEKIRIVLRRLKPLLCQLMRLAHPYISLALFLTGPARTLIQPYVQPFVDKALYVHDGLQRNFLIGPIVGTATNHALEVIDETIAIYNSFETTGVVSKAKQL